MYRVLIVMAAILGVSYYFHYWIVFGIFVVITLLLLREHYEDVRQKRYNQKSKESFEEVS